MNLDSAVFYSNDLQKAVDFYTNVIGLKIEYQQGDKFVSFTFPNGTRLGIKKAVEEREKPGGQTIFISVENIKELYKKFKQMNLLFVKELTDEKWGENFAILDSDNNKIEFVKRH